MSGIKRLLICLFMIFEVLCEGSGMTEKHKVVLVCMAPLSSNLMSFVAGEVSTNLETSSRIEWQLAETDDPYTNLKHLKRLAVDGAVVVGLMAVPGELSFRRVVDSDARVAVLNVYPLMREDEKMSGPDYAWRIVKETTLLAAQLSGFSPCPFPLCVLHEVKTLSALDEKSRNLCPPCRMRLGLESEMSLPSDMGK